MSGEKKVKRKSLTTKRNQPTDNEADQDVSPLSDEAVHT